jgi:hypothetical protein
MSCRSQDTVVVGDVDRELGGVSSGVKRCRVETGMWMDTGWTRGEHAERSPCGVRLAVKVSI